MKILTYLRHNMDLALAMVFALLTSLLVPFDIKLMAGSINYSLLLLLLCLMGIVAGMRESGLFTCFCSRFFRGEISSRGLGRFFIFSCFFSSMAITNDVALIVFVPLAISVLTEARCVRLLIPVVTWQTIAANMGSMLTPIGNPQNLFIYSHYHLSLGEFLGYTAPIVAISGLAIYLSTFFLEDKKVVLNAPQQEKLPRGRLVFLGILFLICLACVLRLIPAWLLALLVLPALGLRSPHLFKAVDYKLLALFLFLFVGVGNLTRLESVSHFATQMLAGNEFLISLALSQVLSNVPTTVMLAPYTGAVRELLLGVNIGGLGTVIASMASVISLKAYMGTRHSLTRQYIASFTSANAALLALLLIIYAIS